MPRLLPNEITNSRSMDGSLSEYVATLQSGIQQYVELQQHSPLDIKTNIEPFEEVVFPNRNEMAGSSAKETSIHDLHEQQIHTIYSSDEEGAIVEQNTIEEVNMSMSSVGSGDFEGFDDYTTPNNSGIINDTSREDLNMSGNCLKRHSQTDLSEYDVDSEDALEPIDLECNEEIIVNKDGKVVYKTGIQVPSKKSDLNNFESYPFNKRKKSENAQYFNEFSTMHLKTPPDQIVEVNSDSTTNSLKQKRQQINNKFQLNLCQQQNYKANNYPNKCSTESTSEFPVSSPSNPQQPRGGKYPTRPPLLKNTLPADSFERQLAMITASNPQMTLAEKIQSWNCDDELSDLEDVRKFDEDFKRSEKQKKLDMKQKKCGRSKNSEFKSYDFFTFRQMIIDNIKQQKNQKHSATGQCMSSAGGLSGIKCLESSESESSKSVVHVDDRPSTSAVAQQQLQRRSKPQLYFDTGEPKKRILKNIPKRNQNSTTPPQTSSSDNERDCFKKLNHNTTQRQIHIHEKLICPSSSEEAFSQDIPPEGQPSLNRKHGQVEQKNIWNTTPVKTQRSLIQKNSNEKKKSLNNSRVITEEEVDSFFRPHRLNKERDKFCGMLISETEDQSASIIQMRLDYTNENKTEQLLHKKQHELFKTPIIPPKYVANPLLPAEYQKQNNNLLTTTWMNGNPVAKKDEFIDKPSPEKAEIESTPFNDFDGIYHQQHEFCNYLGLTGMSTATAMANAVAELAQCNLARRSMRVFRQQQQERREKSAKEERHLKALKLKKLKEVRKREEIKSATEPKTIPKSEEGSHSQVSEPVTPARQMKTKSKNNSTTKSQNSLKEIEKEPEIKILCHIAAAKNTVEAEKLSSDCINEYTQTTREKLTRQAKRSNSDKLTDTKENRNETELKDFKNPKNEVTDSAEDLSVNMKANKTRISQSPSLSIGNHSNLKSTRCRSQFLIEQNEKLEDRESPVLHSEQKGLDTKSKSPFLKIEESTTEAKLSNDSLKPTDVGLISSSVQLISSQPNALQKKIQMALEESRKSKPSIFIVQALESENDKVNNISSGCTLMQQNNTSTAAQDLDSNQELSTECNKQNNNKRKVFKKKKCKKYSLPKRKLRQRKIILIKTIQPKFKKSYQRFNEIKRELRSSPRINENKRANSPIKKFENLKQSSMLEKALVDNAAKSYRTVHTETKDLETYLHQNNSQAKTRLMAKASSLLERSRRMTLRNNSNLINNKANLKPKMQRSKLNLRATKRRHILTSKPEGLASGCERVSNKSSKTAQKNLPKQNHKTIRQHLANTPTTNTKSNKESCLENENVVVSSTTSTFEERPGPETLFTQSPNRRTLLHTSSCLVASSPVQTKNQATQCDVHAGVHYLNTPPLPQHTMRNPLKPENGAVLHIYHELEILIVIQERVISFWKCSKLLNILIMPSKLTTFPNQALQQHIETATVKQNAMENCCSNSVLRSAASPTIIKSNDGNEWIQLGEVERLNHDFEILVPFANRMCLHNSTPIYLEMRAQPLPKNQRDCNLLSMYINIYFYHEEEMIAKRNSIQLDSIQSDVKSVNYTTLIDSRYFIITWPQENLLGKTRSGLCKYSLTPQLDTLASIREFKSMRHTIRYLECMSDDKLIGFGETQVTIWDYRSGDVLMNYDLEMPMGRNLGSIYFPSPDSEQNNILILHQFRADDNNRPSELMTIACTVTHTQPSFKVLQETELPLPAFRIIKSAIKTADHLVMIGQDGDEIWISSTNPRLMAVIPRLQHTKRFYGRERAQLIELTDQTLTVNSLANHILKLAAA